MSSSDASYVSSSDSEAAETEVEYDLEVEGSSNPSEHETSDDEPGDAYAYGSSASSKGIGWSHIPSVLLGRLLQPKIFYLFILTFKSEMNVVLCKKAMNGLE